MKSGLGIRPLLFGDVETLRPDFGFLEAHSENYFGSSIARTKLLALRCDYPISLHGVGLSLGRADDLDAVHLAELRRLVDDIDPLFVSEHLSWSAYSHRHVPDLLPLPLTEGSLNIICQHIDQMQAALGRRVLIENPSNYLLFDQLQIPEPEFLNEVAERTGCGLLLDVNNVHVSASNLQRNGTDYIQALNSEYIKQYHLAGYTEVQRDTAHGHENVLIDTHNQLVHEPVWTLFEQTLQQHGARPTLVEWDSDFPDFSVLRAECDRADRLLENAPLVSNHNTYDETSRNSSVPSLAELQSEFLNAVFDNRLHLELVQPAHQHRIWIYQNNVRSALIEYLEDIFPATRGVVGDEFFKQLARECIKTMPPSNGDIHQYGAQLADTIDAFDSLEELAYLPSLVDYEWALHRAYYSDSSEPLDTTGQPQEELLVQPVALNESVTLLESNYPLYEIHRQSLPDYDGEVSIRLDQSQDNILIFKQDQAVRSQTVSEPVVQFIQAVGKSNTLLEAIEHAQQSLSPQQLSEVLAQVFEMQLLCEN